MKTIYTVLQILSSICTTFVLFALLIQNESKYDIDWAIYTINLAKNWWILSVIVFILAFTALMRYAAWEDKKYAQKY